MIDFNPMPTELKVDSSKVFDCLGPDPVNQQLKPPMTAIIQIFSDGNHAVACPFLDKATFRCRGLEGNIKCAYLAPVLQRETTPIMVLEASEPTEELTERFAERSYGELLKLFRRTSSMTQAILAEKSGLARPYISMIETRYTHAPLVSTARKIVKGLGLDEADWRAQLLISKAKSKKGPSIHK